MVVAVLWVKIGPFWCCCVTILQLLLVAVLFATARLFMVYPKLCRVRLDCVMARSWRSFTWRNIVTLLNRKEGGQGKRTMPKWKSYFTSTRPCLVREIWRFVGQNIGVIWGTISLYHILCLWQLHSPLKAKKFRCERMITIKTYEGTKSTLTSAL